MRLNHNAIEKGIPIFFMNLLKCYVWWFYFSNFYSGDFFARLLRLPIFSSVACQTAYMSFQFQIFRETSMTEQRTPRLRNRLFVRKLFVENVPKSVKKPSKSAFSSLPWSADNVLIATVVASFAFIWTKAIIKCKFEIHFILTLN